MYFFKHTKFKELEAKVKKMEKTIRRLDMRLKELGPRRDSISSHISSRNVWADSVDYGIEETCEPVDSSFGQRMNITSEAPRLTSESFTREQMESLYSAMPERTPNTVAYEDLYR